MDDFVRGLDCFILSLIVLSIPVLLTLSIVFKCTGLVIATLILFTSIDVFIISALIAFFAIKKERKGRMKEHDEIKSIIDYDIRNYKKNHDLLLVCHLEMIKAAVGQKDAEIERLQKIIKNRDDEIDKLQMLIEYMKLSIKALPAAISSYWRHEDFIKRKDV